MTCLAVNDSLLRENQFFSFLLYLGCLLEGVPPSAPPDVPPRNPTMNRMHHNGRVTGNPADLGVDFEPSCLVRTPSGNVYIPSGNLSEYYTIIRRRFFPSVDCNILFIHLNVRVKRIANAFGVAVRSRISVFTEHARAHTKGLKVSKQWNRATSDAIRVHLTALFANILLTAFASCKQMFSG